MDAKSPNRKKLENLIDYIQGGIVDSDRNVSMALIDFANENFVHIVDLADAYDQRSKE